VITFLATRLHAIDTSERWAPPAPSADRDSRRIGGAAVYSADDLLADSARAGGRARQ
jgi:hypothetical protein